MARITRFALNATYTRLAGSFAGKTLEVESQRITRFALNATYTRLAGSFAGKAPEAGLPKERTTRFALNATYTRLAGSFAGKAPEAGIPPIDLRNPGGGTIPLTSRWKSPHVRRDELELQMKREDEEILSIISAIVRILDP